MKLENNQAKSSWGGARKGAGRTKGACTTKTREIADQAIMSGITPLEYLLNVMRNETEEPSVRMDAAKSAAPYVHPRLASESVTVSGTGEGGEILTGLNIRFIGKDGS